VAGAAVALCLPLAMDDGVEVAGAAGSGGPYRSSSATGTACGGGFGVLVCGVDACAGLEPGIGFAPRTLRNALMKSFCVTSLFSCSWS
jgi:hypothetical protein